MQVRFNRMNLPGKLDYIDGALATPVDVGLRDDIVSINRARNCLEHRWGIVGQIDLHGVSAIKMTWKGFESRVYPAETASTETFRVVTEMPVM